MSKVFTYKDFSDEQVSEIIDLYNTGNSTVAIGKMYGVGHKVISRVLDNNGIARTGVGRRKYFLDEHYFDNIDTKNKAYFLGLLYADGSNFTPKQTISISLEENDKHILESFRNELKYDRELEFIDYSDKHDFGYTYKNQYRLSIFSKHMSYELENKGVKKNKSLILEFPDFIRDDLLKYFILGYFDGDGSFCPSYTKNGKFQPLITFTSTKNFCIDLQNYLMEKLNIPCGNIYDASCHNGITSVLSFSGTKQVKTFLDWLYDGAEVYLFRKYVKYINNFDNVVTSLSAQRTDKVTN